MPQVVEAALILRGKLGALLSEKDTLEEEMETVRVKQMVGELTEAAAKKKISKIKEKIARLDREIKEFEGKTGTPLEQLEREHITHAERLQKLENLYQSGEVEKSIYDRLVTEYRTKLAEIVEQLEAERSKAQHWLSELEARQQQLEFDRETYEVRAKLDELPQSQVTRRLQSIEQELSKITQVIVGLRALLGVASVTSGGESPRSRTTRSSSRTAHPSKCPNCGGTVPSSGKWCYHCGNMIK
jgi:DNA repair exonuclease SbcCD ATPase subunit